MRKPVGYLKCIVAACLSLALLNASAAGVPAVKDPHHPADADGRPMKGIDFVQKYCSGKPLNETCANVRRAVSADSSRGKMPGGY